MGTAGSTRQHAVPGQGAFVVRVRLRAGLSRHTVSDVPRPSLVHTHSPLGAASPSAVLPLWPVDRPLRGPPDPCFRTSEPCLSLSLTQGSAGGNLAPLPDGATRPVREGSGSGKEEERCTRRRRDTLASHCRSCSHGMACGLGLTHRARNGAAAVLTRVRVLPDSVQPERLSGFVFP